MHEKEPFKEILECLNEFPQIQSCKIIIDVTTFKWFQIMKINNTSLKINNKWRDKDSDIAIQSLLLEANLKESEIDLVQEKLKESFAKTRERLLSNSDGVIRWFPLDYKGKNL